MAELKDKERLKFVYHANQHLSQDADTIYTCPKCGGNVWEASGRTGTGKLPRDQVKLKCVLCLQWFIGHKDRVEKVLNN